MIFVPPAYEQFRDVDPNTIDAFVEGLKDLANVSQPNIVAAQQVAESLSGRGYPRESVDRLVHFCQKENGPNQMTPGTSMILWFMDLSAWLRRENPV